MIKYEIGDIFNALDWALSEGFPLATAHCCNCQNTMKSGIAPLIARNFPAAWRADQETVRGDRSKLGSITEAWSDCGGILVFNLYGQYGYWNRKQGKMDLEYSALDSALEKMAASLHSKCRLSDVNPAEVKVFLPKIGAGLAGGDWKVIEPMIEKHLGKFDVTVFQLK